MQALYKPLGGSSPGPPAGDVSVPLEPGKVTDVTEGLSLAGGWVLFACLLAALAFFLLRRRP